MSDPKNNSGKTLSTGIESHQGARLNIKSDQGGTPLSQTGSQVTTTSHRIGDSNTVQPALTKPPMPPKPEK